MSKLPVVTGRECIRALEKQGFYVSRQRGSHVIMRHDVARVRVTVPNHTKPLKKGTLRANFRQVGLTVEEFSALL